MFKSSFTLFGRQLIRCSYEANAKCALSLFSKSTQAPYFFESTRKIKQIPALNLIFRNYSKSKDIKKDKKKNVRLDENELAEAFDVEKLKRDFAGPIEYLKGQLMEHATLRSSQGSIENLKVQYEGKSYTIQDLAQVGKKTPRLYVLDFSAFPQTIQAALNVIQSSELNVNAQQEGTKVYVPIAKVTKEHRELLVKKSKGYFNNCKNALRDIQNKYVRNLRNQEGVSSDLKFRLQEQLHAMTEKHSKQAEEILKAKEAELLREEKT